MKHFCYGNVTVWKRDVDCILKLQAKDGNRKDSNEAAAEAGRNLSFAPRGFLECGGKRSAPPLSPDTHAAKALSPLRSASALHIYLAGKMTVTRPTFRASSGRLRFFKSSSSFESVWEAATVLAASSSEA